MPTRFTRFFNEVAEINSLYACKWILALLVSFWTLVTAQVHVLFILMFFDYMSGMLLAYKESRWNWHMSYWGIVSKVFTLMLLLACRAIAIAANVKFDLASGLSLVFSVNEFASFMSNCEQLGVRIPPAVNEILDKMRSFTGLKSKKRRRRVVRKDTTKI